jgi:Tol biopolymer transport system component
MSYSPDLVSGDTNGKADVFVKNMQSGVWTRASVNANGTQGNEVSFDPSISSDGHYVAFTSFASNLTVGDTNGMNDVFVKNMETGVLTLVSGDEQRGIQGNGDSYDPSISADGRYVAFTSEASNLVPGDTNGVADVFVRDLQTGAITRVSTDASGNQGNQRSEGDASISADGRYVAFTSQASNLVPGDTNGGADVFVAPIVFIANAAPIITSNGGGAAAMASVAENTTAVTMVTATDPDAGQTLSYSISGGADAAKFTIGATTGALSFVNAPNFEAPTDAGGNNIYDVIVQVTDGIGGTDTQAIAASVTDANDNTPVAPLRRPSPLPRTQHSLRR